MIGYSTGENHKLEMDINWETLYGKLEQGKYRLVKEVAINNKDTGAYKGNKYIYVEFMIDWALHFRKNGDK